MNEAAYLARLHLLLYLPRESGMLCETLRSERAQKYP